MTAEPWLTQAAAAADLGVAPGTLGKYARQGCPHRRGKAGRGAAFRVGEVRAWMRSKGRTGAIGRPGLPSTPELEAARRRKELALARTYESRLHRERSRLVDAGEVRDAWQAIQATIRSEVLPLADRMLELARKHGMPGTSIEIFNRHALELIGHALEPMRVDVVAMLLDARDEPLANADSVEAQDDDE